MNGNTPHGAISLEDLNDLSETNGDASAAPNSDADQRPMDSFAVASDIQMEQAPTQQLDEETLAKIKALSNDESLNNPNIAGAVQTAEAVSAEASKVPASMQEGGAIDLTALAEMPDAAFEQQPEAESSEPKTDSAEDAPEPEAEPARKTDEEIAAEAEAHRAETEAGLAEASSSMQEMHQNIMAGVKKKEDLAIKASISSKAKKRKKPLSKKAKILVGLVSSVVLVAGGLVFLFASGIIYERSYSVGDWTLRINTNQYNIDDSSKVLTVTDKEEKYQFRYTDIGSANYENLLKDDSGMKSVFAEQNLRYDGKEAEYFNGLRCAVYRLTDRNSNDKMIYSAYCNKGDYMINIYATNYKIAREEEISREALEIAAKIASGASRRSQEEQ